MTTRYQKEQHDEVARILKKNRAVSIGDGLGGKQLLLHISNGGLTNAAIDFADLFAADNPKRCTFHGDHNVGYSEDCIITGFDREQFLAACGLKKEG